MRYLVWISSSIVLPLLLCGAAGAQEHGTLTGGRAPLPQLLHPGGELDQRLRADELLDFGTTGWSLIRSPSSTIHERSAAGNGVRPIAPEARLVYNSAIPFSVNQGAMWAGRGGNFQLLAGLLADAGPLRLILAPQLTYSRNAAFEHLLPDEWEERAWESSIPPWHTGRHSIDLPLRFGDDPELRLLWGQSTVALRAGALEGGLSSENQWWGPGIRNSIVMSSNAAGIPHLFLRTGAPLETRVGSFEVRWISGMLEESGFWHRVERDGTGGTDSRSLSAAAGVFTSAAFPGLSVGVARAVYEGADGVAGVLGHSANVFLLWNQDRHAARPPASEQILSFFWRFRLPAEGAELYGEWARHELPTSFRDLLLAPEHSQGYTLGAQWVGELRQGGALRLQAEHTYLEESPTFRGRPIGTFYSGDIVPQGYTHRGEVIGAAIGPGASGQWLAADYLMRRFDLGAFAGRVRWANDAYYDQPGGHNTFLGHDVSLFGGIRSAHNGRLGRITAEWTLARRYNFLFQNPALDWDMRDLAVNVWNQTLQLSVTPGGGPLPSR
jgi:hypothetical protein